MSGLTTVKTEYTGLQDQVLARVKEKPGESPRDLASYLEANYKSVTRALSRLVAYDLVSNENGQYHPIVPDQLVLAAFALEEAGRLGPAPRTYKITPVIFLGLCFAAGIVGYYLGHGLPWLT